jgi:hypothetical protein
MQKFSEIENILIEYNIPAAAYHSGKFNGGLSLVYLPL